MRKIEDRRAKLVAALRSGEYKQTTGRWAQEIDGVVCYCVIGLGIHLMPGTAIILDKPSGGLTADIPEVYFYGVREREIVARPFVDYYGFTESWWTRLSELNDGIYEGDPRHLHAYTFAELADLIEAEAMK